MRTIQVIAVSGRMCPDYEASRNNIKRYVGRIFDPSVGEAGAFVLQESPITIPQRSEYLQAIKCGDLLPADQRTADLAGVKFKA